MVFRQKKDLKYNSVFLPSREILHGGKRVEDPIKKDFLITIVTVVLNNKNFLEETIKSVLEQDINLEYIIIDGGSTDGTIDVIKKYQNSLELWVSEKDRGIYDAMNKGLKYASGKYIGFLNSGDLYFPKSLNIIKKYIKEIENLDFIFGTVLKKKIKHGFYKNKINWSFDFYPSHSSGFFILNETQKKIGLYDLQFKLSADHDLFYRLIKNNFKGVATGKDEIIGHFRKISGSYSSTFNIEEHLAEEINIRLSNRQNKIIILFVIINNFIRKIFKRKKYSISLKSLLEFIKYVIRENKYSK